MVEDKIQVEKEPKVQETTQNDDRQEVKTPEISPERIQRMKRAFRPTWLHEQIESEGKGSGTNNKKA
jgi:hypothetical protein